MKPAFEAPAPRLFKAVASGNDFLVADARSVPGWDPGAAGAQALCRRHLGLGADGLIVLGPAEGASASFFLRNRDGSTAAFSGNGARCAALLLHRLGASDAGGRVTLQLARRVAAARVLDGIGAEPEVEVSIGAPADVRLDLDLPAGSPVPRGDYAIVGVPYLALRVDEPASVDIGRVAAPLRRWNALPEGANVAFWAMPVPGEPVRLRTFERGVEAETLSSGTGCAMVALAIALRETSAPGDLLLRFAPPSGQALGVTVVRQAGAVTDLLLRGDARLLGEIVPLADALLPDP